MVEGTSDKTQIRDMRKGFQPQEQFRSLRKRERRQEVGGEKEKTVTVQVKTQGQGFTSTDR